MDKKLTLTQSMDFPKRSVSKWTGKWTTLIDWRNIPNESYQNDNLLAYLNHQQFLKFPNGAFRQNSPFHGLTHMDSPSGLSINSRNISKGNSSNFLMEVFLTGYCDRLTFSNGN